MINRETIELELQAIDDTNLLLVHHFLESLKQVNVTSSKEHSLLKDSIIYEGDIISPLDDQWNADQ